MLQNKLHVYCYLFFRTLREISYLKEKKLMHGKKNYFLEHVERGSLNAQCLSLR